MSLAGLAFLAFVAQFLDAVSFILAVDRFGIQGELNPIAGGLATQFGPWFVVALKVSVALGAVAIARLSARPTLALHGIGFIGVAGALSNSATLAGLI